MLSITAFEPLSNRVNGTLMDHSGVQLNLAGKCFFYFNLTTHFTNHSFVTLQQQANEKCSSLYCPEHCVLYYLKGKVPPKKFCILIPNLSFFFFFSSMEKKEKKNIK